MAAVLTTMSMPPNWEIVKFAASARDAEELRSTGCGRQTRQMKLLPASSATLLCALLVKICDDNMSALSCEQQRDFTTDSACSSNDESDLAAEFCFRGHALELGFFERPIFDAEGFRTGKGNIVVELRELLRLLSVARLRQGMRSLAIFQSIGARHHVDGIDEKLSRDARLFFILAETKQTRAPERRRRTDWNLEASVNRVAPTRRNIFL